MTHLRVRADVATALAGGRPVVALESTIISHGLPRPDNLAIARRIEDAVAAGGALPATIAVVGGQVRVGLGDAELERIAAGEQVAKVSVRDLPMAAVRGADGATTAAATAHLAALAGISIMATGGLGGVHRDAATTFDESADLTTLSRTPIAVVCSGVKSILDVGATLERLETLNVGLIGYRTSEFPGFYLTGSGFRVPWRFDSPEEVAAVIRVRAELGLDGHGLIVANPLPPEAQLDPGLHDRVLSAGLALLQRQKITGKDVTPYLLDFFHRETGGESLRANIRLILRNAELAGHIAAALAAMPQEA